jgi:hypothetical protein
MQRAYEQRQEVRETVEDIFQRRGFSPQQQEQQPEAVVLVPGGGGEVATQAAPAQAPGLLVRAVTEAVLFLNSGPLTSAFGSVILLLAIGYLFLARLVDPIIAGLRGGLDIALDVLNYLRPRPKEDTPRARILGRYASLLRYVVDWRDPRKPEEGYARIVILAHSQGSVISSDVLRALALEGVAETNQLERLRADPADRDGVAVRLFTMGSPLRQMYAARFPDLYAWDAGADPRDNHRGLESWWNVYRSGDYVGRMLFRSEADPDRYVPGGEFVAVKDGEELPVREVCLGPGAHTHYWDETAPGVIRDLDRLIACDQVSEPA